VPPLEMFQDFVEENQWQEPGYGCGWAIKLAYGSAARQQDAKTNHAIKHVPLGRGQRNDKKINKK
jgi:hypothetical protein